MPKKQIYSLHVKNFLSLKQADISLNRLNVLVGPNGAGKSNILNILQFLGQVARSELSPAVQSLGGMRRLLYSGKNRETSTVEIGLEGTITKNSSENAFDSYQLSFRARPVEENQDDEDVEGSRKSPQSDVYHRVEELKFKRTSGAGRRITLSGGKVTVDRPHTTRSQRETTSPSLAIESDATGLGTLRRLSDRYGATEWNSFAEVVEDLRLFEINVERCRRPNVMMMSSRLRADGSNLAAFLRWMALKEPSLFDDLCDDVRFVLPSFTGFVFTQIGGADDYLRLDINEAHLSQPTPLARASFGTLRAIALFAMLHDPSPPALTCIEEIDHGLHPHALDRIVDRLREASNRTQIIVATHSPSLVNRLETSDLIVVERKVETGETLVVRPDECFVSKLKKQTEYELGELWFSGALGGGL